MANPYVGPRPFTREEWGRFFGREREARELLALVIAERLVLFYAQSGAGKTSLLHTRLIPQLEEAGYAVLPVGRVGGELPRGVTAVDNIFIFNLLLHLDQRHDDPQRFAQLSLTGFLARLTSPDGQDYYYDDQAEPAEEAGNYEAPIHVLILDQFEEIFTTHLEHWEKREDFFRQLDQAMQADPRLWIVLTLREDYVAALDPYAKLLASRMRTRFYMQRMGYAAALEAVSQPARQYSRPFAPGVAETLVDNLRQIHVRSGTATQPGEFVEPVQLQVVCYQLWENLKQRGAGEITAQDLQQAGDVDTALADFYAQALKQVLQAGGVSETQLRDWFDKELITEAGTRGTVYQGKTDTAGLPNAVVMLLAGQYLLRSESRAGGVWYELVHDRFVEPIRRANRQWWEQQNPLLHAARAWLDSGKDKSKLYGGEPLKEARAGVGESQPEPLVAEFLAASEVENQALEKLEQTRRRELEATRKLAEERERTATVLRKWARALVGVTMVAVLLAVAAVLFGLETQRAKAQANTERQHALRGQSLFLADLARQENEKENFTLGSLLALEALPKSMARPDRPYVAEAERQLYEAAVNLREKIALTGHQSVVYHAAFSPDGRRVVTASLDNTARLWDAASGHLLATLSGHRNFVWHAAFSPDGTRVVTASDDKTARLWDAASGQLLATLRGHQDRVLDAAFSPDGTRVVTASDDKTARLWDAASGQLLATLRGHQDRVLDAAFSPDGTRVVTASADKTARLWDAASGQPLATLSGHQGTVRHAAFSPDGTRVVTASADKTARLWDAASGHLLATLSDHQYPVLDAAFSPDGTRVVTASDDKTARLWDAASGQPLATLSGHQGTVRHAAFSPDGTRVVTASADKTARLWDAASGHLLATLSGHQGTVWHAAFSPDGTRVVTASADKTARLWDAASGQPLATLSGHQGTVRHAAFSPDGTRVVTASADKTARLWDAASGHLLATLSGHQGTVWHAAFSPDGTRVVTASDDKTARLWDAASGHLLATLRGHQDRVLDAAFSPDGTRVVTASWDQTARLWDAASGQLLATLSGHQGTVRHAAFSPDGTRVVTASDDKTARLWDAASGHLLATLSGHHDTVRHAAFSPDGTRVVTVASLDTLDSTARLWDAASGQLLATLIGHQGLVWHAAFSPDGTRVVTASSDNTARLWDAASGQLLATLSGHQDTVWHAAFSPDGTRVVTASDDKTARLWDAASGQPLATLSDHQYPVLDAAFSPDGTRVVTVSHDHTAQLWRVFPKTQDLIDYANRIKPLVSDGNTVKPRELTPEERKRFFLE